MRRLPLRVLMVLTGLSLLVVYLLAAALGYRLLLVAWAQRPSPLRVAAYFLVATVLFGLLSYQSGTAGLLRELDATKLSPAEAPRLHERLERLRTAFDVGDVSVHVANFEAPNALALGGAGGGALVVDGDLFALLAPAELDAILAHELAHMEGRDALVQTLGYTTVRTGGGVLFLALLPVGVVAGGLARALSWVRGRPPRPFGQHLAAVQFAVARATVAVLFVLTAVLRAHSRHREYRADDRAVEVTGDSIALARALVKIQRAATPGWGPLSSLYVHGDQAGMLTRLLATHPPMDERVGRLVERANRQGRRQRRPPAERPPS
ncbi:M48 family metallopeptidase [Natronomonas marina]|jgi:heat shock protein HtpX|uniref:M48 family metallopeptidase n=1 Tax=Natronomonas marina TaxID=2961939 RepID=UPI0020C9412B|nr:M48 family metalloprotease [Natronomonas marina]